MKTNTAKKLKIHSLLSVLTLFLGIALLIFMIIVEDEPGAIPLLLIATGTGWYVITRYRIRSQHNQP